MPHAPLSEKATSSHGFIPSGKDPPARLDKGIAGAPHICQIQTPQRLSFPYNSFGRYCITKMVSMKNKMGIQPIEW
jgi:hypothetical protein